MATPTGNNIQGVFGEFVPVLDFSATISQDHIQGVFGQFVPVLELTPDPIEIIVNDSSFLLVFDQPSIPEQLSPTTVLVEVLKSDNRSVILESDNRSMVLKDDNRSMIV